MARKVTAMDVRMATALAGAVPNVSAFCAAHEISRQTFYKWRRRFAVEGVAGLAERSRRPLGVAGLTPAVVEDVVVAVRKRLLDGGEDHGPESIRWRLLREGPLDPTQVPSRATIWRILVRRGAIEQQPAKRPRCSLHRFTYPRPNDCWQSDWTGWHLTDGSPAAIAGTLDDHSRYLAGLRAGPGDGTGALVWATMTAAIAECGVPARSLTDNGWVYSGTRRGVAVAFTTNLQALGVQAICSTPHHPQTCGKIERLWQTLKRWLAARPTARTVDELNERLEAFRVHYNTARPHRALRGATPAEVWQATPRAHPAAWPLPGPVHVTTSRVTVNGVAAAAGYAINVGVHWAGHTLTVITQDDHITLFAGASFIRDLTADPHRHYQPATSTALLGPR